MTMTLVAAPIIAAALTLGPGPLQASSNCLDRCGTICIQSVGLTEPAFSECMEECIPIECGGGFPLLQVKAGEYRLDCDVAAPH